jgi:AhpD family alkylhydroperoxidase
MMHASPGSTGYLAGRTILMHSVSLAAAPIMRCETNSGACMVSHTHNARASGVDQV